MTPTSVSYRFSSPRIVLVGNQSSGKSSVIGAITGIPLPRGQDTCTRCPVEIQLVHADKDWSCQVSLRIARMPDEPLLAQPRMVAFGEALTRPDLIEERVRLAQMALLGPKKDLETPEVYPQPAGDLPAPQRQHSENTICLTIEHRKATDLVFLDLPGLIPNTCETKAEANSKWVETLVRKSIRPANCLILCVADAAEDFQDQLGLKLARQADPKGQRSIGVLAKPDAIREGTYGSWIELLEGCKDRSALDWYVVKGSGPLAASSLQSRAQEIDIFQQRPWAEASAKVKERLGTSQVITGLTVLVDRLLQQQLSGLEKAICKSLSGTEKRLADLPTVVPDTEAVAFVTGKCRRLSADVRQAVAGTSSNGSSELLREIKEKAFDRLGTVVT